MKTRHLFIVLFAFAMFSCAQEKLEVAQAQMPEELVLKMQTHTVIDASAVPETTELKRPDIKCLDGTCDVKVQKFKAQYQALADATCSIIWGEVKCCLSDQEVYVIILVHPKSKQCLRAQVAYRFANLLE